MQLEVIILAAGQGSRMQSNLPKVLHPLAGTPLVGHVINTAKQLKAAAIHLIIGHGAETVKTQLAAEKVNFVYQAEQLGTGHAVQQAMPYIKENSLVLILYGDVPLIQANTLQKLLSQVSATSLGLLTVNLENPTGYGRIVRNSQNQVTAIVEQKDASPEQLEINEVNTGIMALTSANLAKWLPLLSNQNAQGEYYLTDLIALAANEGISINSVQPASSQEVEGVNTRSQLAALERHYQVQQAEALMAQGVTLADPNRLDVRGNLKCEQDISIDVGCVFSGNVEIASGAEIGPYCVIHNSTIGPGVKLAAFTHLDNAVLAGDNQVGPFARLRPETQLETGAKIGNFVETKKARLAEGAKVNHLSYIGDAQVGEKANIGAGTITCNYDGTNKHQTNIGAEAFIGSNSSLVAPVSIGAKAVVGAGSTITRDVENNSLGVSRTKQTEVKNWNK